MLCPMSRASTTRVASLLAAAGALASGAPQARQSLAGTWRLANANGSLSNLPAGVPGMVHTDLLAAGVISEPFHGFNDAAQQWIPYEREWSYSLIFDASPDMLAVPVVDLVFEGLATVASVTLNGAHVLHATNQFRTWVVPVRSVLVPAGNVLTVAFSSALEYARAADEAYDMSSHNITSCPQPSEHGFCFRNFVRQSPCSFSWDWAPAFAPSGIYKDVFLLARAGAALRAVTVTTRNVTAIPITPGVASEWALSFVLWLDAPAALQGTARVVVAALGVDVSVAVRCIEGTQSAVVNVSSVVAQAWWPRTRLPVDTLPTLYNATVTFTDTTTGEVAVHALRVGLRTAELVQDPLPGGTSFCFRINGASIYAKGSNWLPIDAFESRVTLDNLTAAFDAFAFAGFNVVRHWGGAIYQSDAFFELADERGVLVWMEFSFANGASRVVDECPVLCRIRCPGLGRTPATQRREGAHTASLPSPACFHGHPHAPPTPPQPTIPSTRRSWQTSQRRCATRRCGCRLMHPSYCGRLITRLRAAWTACKRATPRPAFRCMLRTTFHSSSTRSCPPWPSSTP